MSESFIGACVVGNDYPEFLDSYPRATWLQSPNQIVEIEVCHAARIRDKGAKVMAGTQWSAKTGFEWMMFLDADDLVSRELEEWVRLDASDVIALLGGYRWYPNGNFVERTFRLHKSCGSSHLVRLDAKFFPYWLGEKSSGPRVADQSHSEILKAMVLLGGRVQKIRRPIIAYRCGNPNSLAAIVKGPPTFGGLLLSFLKPLLRRRVSADLKDEFMIP